MLPVARPPGSAYRTRGSRAARSARSSPTHGASPCRSRGAGSSSRTRFRRPADRRPCRAPTRGRPGPARARTSRRAGTASSLRADRVGDGRDDLLAVGLQGLVLRVVLQVDGELMDAERLQLLQSPYVLLDRPENAEAVDDLVRHELGVDIARLAVLVVVVPLAALDVLGERRRDGGGLAVARDDVGDVVADHATEPAALIARMLDVVGDVGRRGDADHHDVGTTPGLLGRRAHGADRPFGDVRIGELQDESVTDLADQLERLRTVPRGPDPRA